MKVFRCQRHFVHLYQELLMSQIMLGTAGVLLNMYAYDNNEYYCTGKLGEHSKCCHGNSAFARSQNDIVPEFFQIGETLFLTNDGWSGLVKVKYFSYTKQTSWKFL